MVPRSNPSAMLLETERAARSQLIAKAAAGAERRVFEQLFGGFVKVCGFLPYGKVFETLVGHVELAG